MTSFYPLCLYDRLAAILTGGIIFWTITKKYSSDNDTIIAITWFSALFRVYALWFPAHIVTSFNPWTAFIFSRPISLINFLLYNVSFGILGDHYFGQWHYERLRILKLIRDNIAERGERGAFYSQDLQADMDNERARSSTSSDVALRGSDM